VFFFFFNCCCLQVGLDGMQIYSGCDEAYRLTQSGNLNVPPEATELFCNGPCLAETRLALSCINDVISDFLFYNKATVRDITYALSAGCSSTRQRGDSTAVLFLFHSNFVSRYLWTNPSFNFWVRSLGHHLGEFILLNFLDDMRGGALRSLEEGAYALFDNGTRI
jgi:hypothetical protein